MSLDDLDFTQVEYRILHLTADGKCHSVDEMLACIDPLADKNNLKTALYNLRRKLEAIGQDVIAQSFGRGVKYRRIGIITANNSPQL